MEVQTLLWTNDARKNFTLTDFEGFIIATNGLFYVATLVCAGKTPLITVVTECFDDDDGSALMPRALSQGIALIHFDQKSRLHVPKIPKELHGHALSFFSKVFDTDGSEAIVILFYNANTSSWELKAPVQTVTPGRIRHFESIDAGGKGIYQVGTAHSHGDLDAYQSHTDIDAVANVPGIHITYGRVNQPFPELAAMVVTFSRQILEFDARVLFDNDHAPDFPKEWMTKVRFASPRPMKAVGAKLRKVFRFGRPEVVAVAPPKQEAPDGTQTH